MLLFLKGRGALETYHSNVEAMDKLEVGWRLREEGEEAPDGAPLRQRVDPNGDGCQDGAPRRWDLSGDSSTVKGSFKIREMGCNVIQCYLWVLGIYLTF